jgi:hypothetical protein
MFSCTSRLPRGSWNFVFLFHLFLCGRVCLVGSLGLEGCAWWSSFLLKWTRKGMGSVLAAAPRGKRLWVWAVTRVNPSTKSKPKLILSLGGANILNY